MKLYMTIDDMANIHKLRFWLWEEWNAQITCLQGRRSSSMHWAGKLSGKRYCGTKAAQNRLGTRDGVGGMSTNEGQLRFQRMEWYRVFLFYY